MADDSDDDATNRRGGRQDDTARVPEARRRRSRWPGWVWAIPLAALAVVGWLGVKQWVSGSRDVTVRFARAEGLSPGAAVRFRGVKVGRVTDITLDTDLHHVDVALAIDEPFSRHVGAGTQFWIAQPQLAKGQISALMAGSQIDVLPVDGAHKALFDGLETPPAMSADRSGRRFILTADDAGGLSRGAPVLFRGVAVGRVLGVRLDGSRKQAEIYIFVKAQDADLVKRHTTFWRAGGISVSMTHGMAVSLPSLQTVISGAIAFGTPTLFAGPAAGANATFPLYANRDTAEASSGGPAFSYFIRFPEAVGGLVRGAPVTFGGRRVGRVERVGLPTNKKSGRFTTPVEVSINALALDLHAGTAKTRNDLRDRLNQALATLVEKGLRADVSPGGLLSGKSIKLEIAGSAPPAALDRKHQPPAIPAATSGNSS